MSLDGKTLQNMIARRAERRTEAKREAQGMLFSSREAEFAYLAERAEKSLFMPIAELDAYRERERTRKKR